MAGKGDGEGEGNILKLENQIAVIKYVLIFTNILSWMTGACIFALCLWLRFEPGIQEWLQKLNAEVFYSGVYVLIFAALLVMIVSFLGCISALQEAAFTIFIVSKTLISLLDEMSFIHNN
nr:tetraspanin-2A [Leptinotarsa decemlineata]